MSSNYNCPRCGRNLSHIDGSWICFEKVERCGIMQEGRLELVRHITGSKIIFVQGGDS